MGGGARVGLRPSENCPQGRLKGILPGKCCQVRGLAGVRAPLRAWLSYSGQVLAVLAVLSWKHMESFPFSGLAPGSDANPLNGTRRAFSWVRVQAAVESLWGKSNP